MKNPAFTPNEMSEAEMNLDDIKKKYAKRKQWFVERIGKRVFRTKGDCPCETCERVFQHGLVISDAMHADYLWTVEMEIGLTYYDTKEETQ